MWSNILGHTNLVERLQKAIIEDQLAAATIFSGPDGVGKFTTAMNVAMALLCPTTSAAIPCFECSACRRLQAEHHPDCMVIRSEKTEISINQMRAMIKILQLHSVEGGAKIVIIDGAEKMTPAAANACLKIIEEPPQRTYFILITSQMDDLLATIRSRCQKLIFAPLDEERLSAWLVTKGIPADEARQLAIVTGGSLGAALRYPIEALRDVVDTLTTLTQLPTRGAVLSAAEKWAANTDDLAAVLNIIHILLHRAYLHQNNALLPQEISLLPSTKRLILEFSGKTRLMDRINAVRQSIYQLGRPYNKQLMMEEMLFSVLSR